MMRDTECGMGDVGCKKQDEGCRRRLLGGGHRLGSAGSGVQRGLQMGAAGGVQSGAGKAEPPSPAVPYCSWPAEEDLVLLTRCNTEPSQEQDSNKRRRRRKEGIGEIRL